MVNAIVLFFIIAALDQAQSDGNRNIWERWKPLGIEFNEVKCNNADKCGCQLPLMKICRRPDNGGVGQKYCGCVFAAKRRTADCTGATMHVPDFGNMPYKVCIKRIMYAGIEKPENETPAKINEFELVGGVYLEQEKCSKDDDCSACRAGFNYKRCIKNASRPNDKGDCVCQSTTGPASNNAGILASLVAKLSGPMLSHIIGG